jgi:hypothetical protein
LDGEEIGEVNRELRTIRGDIEASSDRLETRLRNGVEIAVIIFALE